ncbi:unnamed protein product, partial [Amoebophrya sp. A120]
LFFEFEKLPEPSGNTPKRGRPKKNPPDPLALLDGDAVAGLPLLVADDQQQDADGGRNGAAADSESDAPALTVEVTISAGWQQDLGGARKAILERMAAEAGGLWTVKITAETGQTTVFCRNCLSIAKGGERECKYKLTGTMPKGNRGGTLELTANNLKHGTRLPGDRAGARRRALQ